MMLMIGKEEVYKTRFRSEDFFMKTEEKPNSEMSEDNNSMTKKDKVI